MFKYACRRGLTAVLLLLVAFISASAQEFRGSITGKVTDPNEAVVPGAEVSIKNIETNAVTTTTTNEDGSYSFPLLQPGKYTLTVTKEGFNTAAREGIEVRVADKLTLDVKMDIGVSATVTTVTDTPVLETGAVNTGTVVTSQQISELPLTEGTAYQLATLAPGVAYTGNPLFTGPTSNGNLAAFRSNGTTGSNQITLDGQPNYAFDGGVGFSPPSDAVQEFKVQTSAFDAQQGYSAGATVNVAVKSGTNDFHGSLWYFNRDRSRTANNYFSNLAGQDRPERTYHRFGGVVGGPVLLPKIYNGRDKTFFLVSYERLKDNVAEPQLFTVPTALMRQGNFSEFLTAAAGNVTIFNPFSAPQTGTGNFNRTAFTGNIIPGALINPAAQAYLNLYPSPNVAGTAGGTQNNFFSNMIRHENYRGWLTRIDHRISASQSIFGKYYHSFNPEDRYDWAGIVNGIPVTQGFEFRTNDGGSLDYTNTLNSNMVLDLKVGLNRFTQERQPAATYDLAAFGLTPAAVAVTRGYTYLPRFDIRTYDRTRPVRSTLGSNRADYDEGLLRPFYMASFQPSMTQTYKSHTFRYGYDLRVLRENFITSGYQGGRYFFDGTYTAPASNSSSTLRNVYGRDLAAFLLGIPTASTSQSLIDTTTTNYSVQSIYHGFFFQDDWRVSPRLTLNLGLRYELEEGLTERYNRLQRGFDLTTPTSIDAAARQAYTTAFNANPNNFLLSPANFRVVGGYTFANDSNRATWNADKANWQPRVGASFQLNQQTVLRGGFGIFMSPFQIESPEQVGFAASTAFIPTNNNGRTFIATLNNPFPNGLTPAPGSSLGLLTSTGQDVGASDGGIIPTNRKNAKFARLVVGFSRELPKQFVFEANFVSSWGYDLAVNRNLNFVPRQFLADLSGVTNVTDATNLDTAANNNLSTTIPNPFLNLLSGTGSPFNTATTITRAQSLLAYPQFTNLWVQEYNGSNRYNALQLQVTKRYSRNLSLTTTYTYSRLREKVSYLNPSDTQLEDRISTLDRPHRFTFGGTYQLPFGRGQMFGKEMNRVLNAFIGGWRLNGTYEWQSGEPLLLTAAPLFYAGNVNEITSMIGKDIAGGGKYGIDRSAISAPAGLISLSSFSLRNVPTTLDNVRNQGYSVANLSLTKDFKFGEVKRLQVRAEALNAFNHPYFGSGIGLNPGTVASPNAAFGIVTTQRNNPRDIQLGVKFTF